MSAGLSSGDPIQSGFSKEHDSSESVLAEGVLVVGKALLRTRGECLSRSRRNTPPPQSGLSARDSCNGKWLLRTKSQAVSKDRYGCTGVEWLVVHHVRSCLTVLPSPGAIYSSETVTCRACNSAIFEYRHGKWIRCKNHIPLVSSILFLGSSILSNGPRFAVPHALGECPT